MARAVGTTRIKKPIGKYEFERLMGYVNKSNEVKQQRLKNKLRRAFTLLFITGCRISEIADFTKGDIEAMVEKKEFSLTNNTKTKKSRLIVIGSKQAELLKTIIPAYANASTRLFDVDKQYLTIKLNKIIHKALGELYSTHSFRAGYITRLANNGENIKLIQEDIGHTNIATTALYIKVTDEDKRNAKEKLDW